MQWIYHNQESTNFMATTWKDDTNAKIYNYVTVNELEKELENYGFKIYKIGNVKQPTNVIPSGTTANYIDNTTVDNSKTAPTTAVEVYIYDGKTSTEDVNKKKMTIYKYTLKFQSSDTVVSAVSGGIVDVNTVKGL